MADTLFSDVNPYEPPRVACEPVAVLRTNPGAKELHAQRVHRGLLQRTIRFYGEYEALVDWNGFGASEIVSLDARVVESKFNWGPHVIPRFDIPVDAGYPATLTVEIRTAYLVLVSAFRILLDDRVLYAEGEWAEASKSPIKPK